MLLWKSERRVATGLQARLGEWAIGKRMIFTPTNAKQPCTYCAYIINIVT